MPPARVLAVACGTGYLTRHMRGFVVGSDQSMAVSGIIRSRLVGGEVVRGDALALPFPDHAFGRVLTGHFYGHLPPGERRAFLCAAKDSVINRTATKRREATVL